MVLLIIIPIKWLFHWEYTLFSDKPEWGWMQFGEEELCFKTLQDASGKTSGMPHGRRLSNTSHRVGWSCSESIWKPFLKAMASEAKDGKGHGHGGHGGHGCGRHAFPEAALLCKQISWRLKRARLTMGVFGVGTDAQPLPQCWASVACALTFCKISMIQHCDCYRCCSQTCQSFFAPIVLSTSFSSPWSSVDLPCLLDYFCQFLPRLFLVTLQSLRFFPFCLTSQAWAQSQRRGYITPKAIPQGAMAGSKRFWQTIFAL